MYAGYQTAAHALTHASRHNIRDRTLLRFSVCSLNLRWFSRHSICFNFLLAERRKIRTSASY